MHLKHLRMLEPVQVHWPRTAYNPCMDLVGTHSETAVLVKLTLWWCPVEPNVQCLLHIEVSKVKYLSIAVVSPLVKIIALI